MRAGVMAKALANFKLHKHVDTACWLVLSWASSKAFSAGMHSILARTVSGACYTQSPCMLQELAAQAANDFAAKPRVTQRRIMNAYCDKTSDMSQDPEQMRSFGFGIALYIRMAPQAERAELLGLAKVHHLDSQQSFVLSSCM